MEKFVPILKALADVTRYKILSLLLTHDLCVGALADRLAVSKAAVSQHLQILRKAGLVKGEKRGYWTHYAIERRRLKEVADELIRKAEMLPGSEGLCHRAFTAIGNNLERRDVIMCNDCCQQPEKLKGKPQDCSADQIKECHGEGKEHACVKKSNPNH